MPRGRKKTEETSEDTQTEDIAEDVEVQVEEVAESPAPAVDVSPFMEQMIKATKKHNALQGADKLVVGLEPYGLVLQYLMDLQVFPLQAVVLFSGLPKTYKTSTLLEICNMFLTNGTAPGFASINHTEGKWSNSKVRSQIQDPEVRERLHVVKATSIEEWQQAATSVLNTIKSASEKKLEAIKKKAKTSAYKDMVIPPTIIGVDSLTGSQTNAIKDKIVKDGHGAKTFQDRAMLIWQWLDTWSSDIVGLPATVVITQHLKDKIDANPMARGPKHTTAGGTGGDYHTSLEIRASKIKEIAGADWEGAELMWKTHFNSLGRDNRKVVIKYIETYDEEDNQVAYFDWDTAIVDLILMLFEKGSKKTKDRLSAVLGDFRENTKPGVGKRYVCEALGIDKAKSFEDNISAEVLGKMLQEPESEIRENLRKALLIQPGEQWTPDTVLDGAF